MTLSEPKYSKRVLGTTVNARVKITAAKSRFGKCGSGSLLLVSDCREGWKTRDKRVYRQPKIKFTVTLIFGSTLSPDQRREWVQKKKNKKKKKRKISHRHKGSLRGSLSL